MPDQPAPRLSLFAVWRWPRWIWVIVVLIFPPVWFSMLRVFLHQVTEERRRQTQAEHEIVRENLRGHGLSMHKCAESSETDQPADALDLLREAN